MSIYGTSTTIYGITSSSSSPSSASIKGDWDALTNSPELISSTGSTGDYYRVSVSGSTNLDEVTDWVVGDTLYFDGTQWVKVDNSDSVTSVSGKTGDVLLSSSDVGLSNVPNVDTSDPSNVNQSSSYRFVTDTEKSTWNSKQTNIPQLKVGSAGDLWDMSFTSYPTYRGTVTTSFWSDEIGLTLSQGLNENGSIKIDGYSFCISNPADGGAIRFNDEDNSSLSGFTISSGGSISSLSDINLKKLNGKLSFDLKTLLRLQAYKYEWISYIELCEDIGRQIELLRSNNHEFTSLKYSEYLKDDTKDSGNKLSLDDWKVDYLEYLSRKLLRCSKKKSDLGFIAQDIRQFAPDCVSEEHGSLLVNWRRFNSYFQQAVIDIIRSLDSRFDLFAPDLPTTSSTLEDSRRLLVSNLEYYYNSNTFRKFPITYGSGIVYITNSSSTRQLLSEQIYLIELNKSQDTMYFDYFDSDSGRVYKLSYFHLVSIYTYLMTSINTLFAHKETLLQDTVLNDITEFDSTLSSLKSSLDTKKVEILELAK